MVNSVKNDKGEYVIAVGAPSSEARVAVEYPKLIEDINKIYFWDTWPKRQDLAIELIRERGIKDPLTTTSIMNVSAFGQDKAITRYWDF